jgi:gliding motility-associated-like protein
MNLAKSKFISFWERLILVIVLIPLFYSISRAQSCNVCTDVVPTDLVGCYRLNNNAKDGSGNNYHGTASNITYGLDRFSRPAMAGNFNGTSSSVSIPATPYNGLNTYTYSLWVKLSSLPVSGTIYSLLSIGTAAADQFISIATNPVSGNNGIGYSSYFSTGIPDRYANGVSPTVGVWYHIALTRTTTALNFYINGVLVDTRPTSNPVANYGSSGYGAVIGSRTGTITQNTNGSLDNVRIYSRDLTLTEIQQLYNEAPGDTVFAKAGNDTTIIAGDSAQLNASGGTTYSWSPSTGLSNASIANPKASPTATTTYIVTVTEGNCINTDTVVVTVIPPVCNVCTDVVPSGLIGCYRLNNNTQDGSSLNNHGTGTNLTYGADRYSKPQKAGVFNGTSSNVSIPATPYIGLNTYTYSLWVKLTAIPASGTLYSLLSIGDGTLADQFISIATNPVSGINGIGYSSYIAVGTPDRYATGVSPTVGVWYHIALTRTTTTLKFYINGILKDTKPTSTPIANYGVSGYSGFIGSRVGAVTQNTNGSLDNVRIYNRALSAAEITQLFNEAPETNITANAGVDTAVCTGDSIQLTASGGITYKWTPSASLSNDSIYNPYAKPVILTNYIVTVTSGLCSAKDTITVTVSTPIIANAGTDTSLCVGDSIRLTAIGGGKYKWSPNNATISNDTLANPYVKPATTTEYIVTVTSGACSDKDTVAVTVSTPLTVNAGGDQNICIGDSIQLTASGGGKYKWTPNATVSNDTLANPYIKPITTTNYIVTATSGSCTDKDTVTVIVSTLITANAGVDTSLCAGDSIRLTATGGGKYKWIPSATVSNDTLPNPYVKPLTLTDYIVTVTSGACSDKDTVNVTVYTSVTVNAGMDQNICIGDSLQLTATGGGKYKWAPNTSVSNDTLANPYVKPVIPTDYIVTATSGFCFDKDTVTVTVSNTITANAGADQNICLGDSIQLTVTGGSKYKWTPNTAVSNDTLANPYVKPLISTDYIVTITSGSCTDKDTVIVTVSTPITANAGTDTSLCVGDSIRLTATGGGKYKWMPAATVSNDTLANPYVKPIILTDYVVTVTSGACSDKDTVTVTVSSLVTANAGTDKNICIGDSIQLTAMGGSKYKWTPNIAVSDDTLATPYVKPVLITDYIVTVIAGACSDKDTVRVNASTLTPDAGADKNICSGDSVQLTATGGTKYKWTPNATVSNDTLANPYVSPVATFKYFVSVSDGVCSKTDSVRVIVAPVILINAGLDTNVCENDSIQLTAVGATTYKWYPSAGVSDTSIANPKVSPAGTVTYKVIGTVGTCTAIDSVVVTLKTLPTINAGVNDTVCSNTPFHILGVASNADQYKWTPSTYLNSDIGLQPISTPSVTTQYIVKATNSVTTCSNYDTIVVAVNDPVASFTVDTVSGTIPFVVQFTNTSIATNPTYIWYFEDVDSFYTEKDQLHTYSQIGDFRVELVVTDENGCFSSTDTIIRALEELKIFIPNVFTPNGDGLNEFFEVRYTEAALEYFEGTIWNRWGGKVYEYSMPGGTWWNGKEKGQLCSEGVYFYIIETKDHSGRIRKYNGTVTLIR